MLRQTQPDLSLLHGMERVGIFPLANKSWIKLIKPSYALKAGMSNANAAQSGWHCAACFKEFKNTDRSKLLVMGNLGGNQPFFCAYLGSTIKIRTSQL